MPSLEEIKKRDAEKLNLKRDNIGLDVIEWRLEKGNLLIQQKVEAFISQLKKENGVTPS